MSTQPDPAVILRQPFAPEQIGKLPKISCRACSKAPGKVCSDHSKSKCKACGNYITTAHVDLDYVGHAGVTDRLLQADPTWTWEPLTIGDDGVPVINVANGEATMWIRMTVNGVTRIGVGSAPAQSFELHKQLISDAIRNVAMRFGVALDLWSKEPLPEAMEHDDPTPPVAKTSKSSGGGDARPPVVASPGVPAPDPEAPGVTAPVESAASDGEVGSAPVGGAHAPGGKNATGGGQEPAHSTAATVAEACRSPQRGASDEAPLGASTPSGGCTLDDLDAALPTNKWNRNKVLREARRIATEEIGLEKPPNEFDDLANPEYAPILTRMCELVGAVAGQPKPLTDKQRGFMHAVWAKHGGDDARKAAISRLTSGRTDSSSELTADEVSALMDLTAELDKEAAA